MPSMWFSILPRTKVTLSDVGQVIGDPRDASGSPPVPGTAMPAPGHGRWRSRRGDARKAAAAHQPRPLATRGGKFRP